MVKRSLKGVFSFCRRWRGLGAVGAILLLLNSCSLDSLNRVTSAVAPLASRVQSSPLCPFEGVELTVRVQPSSTAGDVTPELVEAVRQVFERRLRSLKLPRAAVVALKGDLILVQVEDAGDVEPIARLLIQSAQLEFRPQKPGTETQLIAIWQQLRELEAKDQDLQSSFAIAADREANQGAIADTRSTLASLFLPSRITGANITEASAEASQFDDRWEILIQFDRQGTDQFTAITQTLAGTGRTLGIFLDDELLSAPTVDAQYAETGITGGKAMITGAFTAEAARNLAIQLRSGSLPAPVEYLKQTTASNNRCQERPN